MAAPGKSPLRNPGSTRQSPSLSCVSGRLGLAPGPVLRIRLGALQRRLGFESWCHRGIGSGQHLMMLDIERPEPPLLTHCECDEEADFYQLRLAEMLMQPCPQLIVDWQVPGDRLSPGERRLLPVVVTGGLLD
jgi:hypothetical protein